MSEATKTIDDLVDIIKESELILSVYSSETIDPRIKENFKIEYENKLKEYSKKQGFKETYEIQKNIRILEHDKQIIQNYVNNRVTIEVYIPRQIYRQCTADENKKDHDAIIKELKTKTNKLKKTIFEPLIPIYNKKQEELEQFYKKIKRRTFYKK